MPSSGDASAVAAINGQPCGAATYVTCYVTPDLTDRELERLSGYANRLREVNAIITFERIEL